LWVTDETTTLKLVRVELRCVTNCQFASCERR
jgi:hypothetical protein